MNGLKIKNIPWWIRMQLYFCKWQCAVDPASIDDVGSIMYYKVLRGRIYVLEMKILPKKGVKDVLQSNDRRSN